MPSARKAVELHPYLQIVRVHYGQALEFSGRFAEALRQYQIASVMSPDLPWLRALEGTCLAKMGREAEADAILAELDELRRSEYVDAYYMAVFRQALKRTDEAWLELERSVEEYSGLRPGAARRSEDGRVPPRPALRRAQSCRTTFPPFITNRTRCKAVMSAVGSPGTATRSANLPLAIDPI